MLAIEAEQRDAPAIVEGIHKARARYTHCSAEADAMGLFSRIPWVLRWCGDCTDDLWPEQSLGW
jgi:hypothetical protein